MKEYYILNGLKPKDATLIVESQEENIIKKDEKTIQVVIYKNENNTLSEHNISLPIQLFEEMKIAEPEELSKIYERIDYRCLKEELKDLQQKFNGKQSTIIRTKLPDDIKTNDDIVEFIKTKELGLEEKLELKKQEIEKIKEQLKNINKDSYNKFTIFFTLLTTALVLTLADKNESFLNTLYGRFSEPIQILLGALTAAIPVTIAVVTIINHRKKKIENIEMEFDKIRYYSNKYEQQIEKSRQNNKKSETTIKTIPIQYYDVKKDNLDYNENDKLRQIREAKQKLVAAKAKLTEAAKQNVTTIPKQKIKKTTKNYRPRT